MRCYLVEGCRWSEHALAVQDAWFLSEFLQIHNQPHGGRSIPHVGTLAGWRREHIHNLMAHTNSLGFDRDAEAWLESGWLETA